MQALMGLNIRTLHNGLGSVVLFILLLWPALSMHDSLPGNIIFQMDSMQTACSRVHARIQRSSQSCHVEHSEPYHSCSLAHKFSKTLHKNHFEALAFSIVYSNANCLQYSVAAQTVE
jgi:hypothetical protein